MFDVLLRRARVRPAACTIPRLVLASSIAICAMCCAVASSAWATEARWAVSGKLLEKGQIRNATSTFRNQVWRLNNGALVWVCPFVTDHQVIIPPLNDATTEYRYGTCEMLTPTSCTLVNPMPFTMPFHTTLPRPGKKGELDDLEEGFDFTTTVSGAKCELAGKYEITGNLEGKFNNSTSTLEYPETPLAGSTLKSGGKEVSVSGTDEIELEGGGKLEVKEVSEKEEKELKEKEEKEEKEQPLISPTPTRTAPLDFTATSGTTVLESVGKSKVECKEGSATGEFSGVREGVEAINLHGCKDASVACKTVGESKESVSTKGNVQLVDLEKAKVLTLGLEYVPSELTVECGVVKVIVKGSVIGEMKGFESGKASKTGTWLAKQEGGKQAITECQLIKRVCEGAKVTLEANFGKAFEQAGLGVEEKLTLSKEATFDF